MDRAYINIHTHRRTGESFEVVSVMAGQGGLSLPEPPLSVGLHPWQLSDMGEVGLDEALREVETASANAIGEIGLDFSSRVTGPMGDYGLQKMIFAAQLRIAEERRLPVILHCVRAFEPTMEILSGFHLPAVVFHGFVGSRQQAARAVKSGYYLSFGERMFSSPKTVEAMRHTPLERLFLETDEASVSISEVYARVAELLDIPVEGLAEQLYNNYLTVFG